MNTFDDERFDALFGGNYICSECGAKMQFEDEEWKDTLVCPKCGYSIGIDEFLDGGDEENYRPPYDNMPEGCAACGGPYPDCVTLCELFDN